MKSIKLLLVLGLFYFGNLNQLYSQKFVLSSAKIYSDSIIDIVQLDSSGGFRIFCKYLKTEISEDKMYWKINQFGIISPENRKLFFGNGEEYIGSIDDYFYTANYMNRESRIINCYKLEKGELLLMVKLKLDLPIGYFQINRIGKMIIFINSSEGYGNNIMIFDKSLNQVLDYKPFDGLFKEYTISEMLSQFLNFSFHSDDNPAEYKIIGYDLMDKKIVANILLCSNAEYLDQIISCNNGELVFSNYDLMNYYITKYNYNSNQIISQSTFNFGTRIIFITGNEILIFNNFDLCYINISTLTENWKLKLKENKHENIVITNYNKISNILVEDSTNNNCFIVSKFDSMNNHLINNNLYIISDTGELIESFILPKEFQINPNLPMVFSLLSGVKIISGVTEIELIEN